MKKINLLFLIGFLLTLQAEAQRSYNYWSVGGSIGVANYFGDLAPKSGYGSTNLRYTRPSFSGFISRKFNSMMSVDAELAYQRLMASDFESADPRNVRHRFRYLRNASFRNDIFELDVRLTIDLFPSRGEYYRRPTYRPYVFAGIGVLYHNPKAKIDGDWVRLQPLRTEGQGLTPNYNPDLEYRSKTYSLIQPTIPFGVGLKYKLNDRMDLAFEIGYRYLFTDYIDDVSGNYADPRDLEEQVSDLSARIANRSMETTDAIKGKDRTDFITVAEGVAGFAIDERGNQTVNGFGRGGEQRGEKKDLDIYIVTGFKLHIILGTGVKCPKFRR